MYLFHSTCTGQLPSPVTLDIMRGRRTRNPDIFPHPGGFLCAGFAHMIFTCLHRVSGYPRPARYVVTRVW